MKPSWSKLFTVIAGVLGALSCYGVLMHVLLGSGLVWHGGASLQATKMISANVGAIAAAAAVAAWPSDRTAPLFESLTTWALATMMLMVLAAPLQPVPSAVSEHNPGPIAQNFASR